MREGCFVEHEFNGKLVTIDDTDISFEAMYRKEYIPKEYMEDIQKANLLIIPNENFRGKGNLLFPETTPEFLELLREGNNEIVADIAIGDENFQRIELHSAVIEVATFIVEILVLPVAINMISSFLYDQVKKHRRNADDTTANVQIIVEETKRKKTKKIVYKGPVSELKDTLNETYKDLFSKD